MSLRERLNSLGIDGHKCEEYINDYLALVRVEPTLRMNAFLDYVKADFFNTAR